MKEFRAIAIDPPWKEPGGNGKGSDDHYDTTSPHEILGAIVRAPCWRPAVDCHLYLWTTMTSLLKATWLMSALGFEYKTNAIWMKTKADGSPLMGIGQYFRGAHELVLFGTRGKGFAVRTEHKGLPSVFCAPPARGDDGQRIHSAKPDAFYELVEQRSHGPWLDMFARRARDGWTVWGNEAPEPTALADIGDDGSEDDTPPWDKP